MGITQTNQSLASLETAHGDVHNRQQNSPCVGILNKTQTFFVGGGAGFYGWRYRFVRNSHPEFFPLPNIYAFQGDILVFAGYPNDSFLEGTNDDLWAMNTRQALETCDFTNSTLLANASMMNMPGGYRMVIKHATNSSNTLWFSAKTNCHKNLKVTVHIIAGEREVIPIVNGSGQSLGDSETVKELKASVAILSRQSIMQQYWAEQRIRSAGHSGISDVRGWASGDDDYNDVSYAGMSIHNHPNHIATVGIGEFQAVLNGVEFTTRHNDYRLREPSKTEKTYGKTSLIDLPDVPPSVLSHGSNLTGQIEEMRLYFKAFKMQDTSIKADYKKYFPAIMCYLEGAWITDKDALEEPFESDRHHIAASTWRQLNDYMRWITNSGRKSKAENLALLPSSIRDLMNDTYPVLANWEYRVACHKYEEDIPLSRFRVARDLQTQLFRRPATRKELYLRRSARFEVNGAGWNWRAGPSDPNVPWSKGGGRKWDFWDYLMEQIPGKDNYPGDIIDQMPDGSEPTYSYINKGQILNVAYYSRYYSLQKQDAMGAGTHRRGWHEFSFLFFAFCFAASFEA